MLEWLFNPEGVGYGAYVLLWIALIIIFPVSLLVGGLRALWAWREKRDGIEKR